MIYAQPGATFEATVSNAPTGLVGTLGVRIMDGQGATVLARATTGIVESPAGSGIYTATLTAPTTAGQYVIAWDTGGATSTWASEDLTVTSSAVVAAVPTGLDLCTLADVRALMQKSGTDVAQDALIASLITRVSTKIMRDTGREFVPGGPDGLPATAATRTFEFPWESTLVNLAPYDLKTVTAVKVDTDQGAGIVLSTDEYRTWPQPARYGTYQALRVQPFSSQLGRVMWRNRQLAVTGDWGFPSIPPEVTQAAAETVVHWITANPAAHRFAGSPDSGVPPVAPRGYPMSALDLLSGFKRMTV